MSCCPPELDICIYQNTTFLKTLIWTAGYCPPTTQGAAPAPVDLTGYLVNMQIRAYRNPAAPLLFDMSSYITLGGTAGTITINIPAAVTGGLTFLSGVYDLLLTSSQGVAVALLSGNVTVAPSVSV